MNLGQFHARIKRALRRGNSMDAVIPDMVSESANVLEMNYTFSWMRRTGETSIALGSNNPNQLSFPNNRVKSFEWIKVIEPGYASPDGEVYRELKGVDARRITGTTPGYITGYWIDGLSYVYLDNYVAEDTAFLWRWAEYTDWPEADAATPSLLMRGQAVLAAETMLLAAQENRDPRMIDLYTARRNDTLNMLLRAEEELKWEHQNDLVMRPYGN